MKPVKILCPTGHLSFTPLEPESFLRGCEQNPDFIIADAGSCDIGPRPLGADQHVSHEAWQRHDLSIMLRQARRLNVPMIVGSASDTGTNRGVDQFVGIIRGGRRGGAACSVQAGGDLLGSDRGKSRRTAFQGSSHGRAGESTRRRP